MPSTSKRAGTDDDLAVLTNLLDGCAYLHSRTRKKIGDEESFQRLTRGHCCHLLHFLLLPAVDNSPLREIKRGKLEDHIIAGENLNIIKSHFTGDVGIDFMTLEPFVDNLDDEMGIGKRLNDDPCRPYIFLLCQGKRGFRT